MTDAQTAPPGSEAPVWSLDSYFPAIDSEPYRAHRAKVEQGIADLAKDADAIGALTVESAPRWKAWLLRQEDLVRDYSHLASYIGCLNSADSNNEENRREQAALARVGAAYRKCAVPFQAALREADDAAFEALASDPELESARHFLERERHDAQWTMAPELELLAADLGVDGIGAWGRLYNAIAGKLTFRIVRPDGTEETVPMAQRAILLDSTDAEFRRHVFERSNEAWETVEDAVAACLNGIGGWRLTLNERRGVEHFLDVAAFQSSVRRETVETMWSAIAELRELPRRYLRHKARLLGKERLGFQDLAAPLPVADSRKYTWEEGTEILLGAFDASYPALAEFTREMIADRRIEAQRRAGKRPGAFCTSSYRTCESRVFMNYGGTANDLRTLAHELGHAWHNRVMADIRPFARMYPMTLAETASTFAEDILTRELLRRPGTDPEQRAQLLDALLLAQSMMMLNIHMRYTFEERFYTERAAGEVSVSRLKELMLEAQRACYGDVLAVGAEDPFFWASKLHFYIVGVTFYNFPYTFGYLLSQGLSALFAEGGAGFLPRYEAFLRLTGSASAEAAAAQGLDVNLAGTEFWSRSILHLQGELEEFERLSL